MGLTSIGIQKTPGRPTEVTFAAAAGLPNPNQTINLIGHMGPTGGAAVSGVTSGSSTPYVVVVVNNVADPTAGATEANAKFGTGSELAKMVIACIKANSSIGGSNFPNIIATPLAQTDAGFGALNAAAIPAALAAAEKYGETEFLVSPYDATNQSLTGQLVTAAATMSGATRTANGQYGTIGIAANMSVQDPSTLFKYDTQYLSPVWFRNSAPVLLVAELAAAYSGSLGGNAVPFNPVDGLQIGSILAPVSNSDWITVGAGLESESALNQGWTPLQVLPNTNVVIVRSVTSRVTTGDSVTAVTAYYDVQDFQVLYFTRKSIVSRFNQPDFQRVKASTAEGKVVRGEVIAILSTLETQGMLQAVEQLAPQVVVQRNVSDRSRFDVFIPVNVVPGLHVIASNIQAGTQFDSFTA
jgi:phage tail sheath gpL-like